MHMLNAISIASAYIIMLASFQTKAIDIIAHRGASGYLPEHTKEALVLAYMQGADYIEQDLVLTKDDVLVVLHDIHLETVTNVEYVYPKRAREDGRWYAIDFNFDELRRLSVHERQNNLGEQVFAERYQGKAHFSIASFDEHIELISELNRALNRNVGIYPEIKSPAWHASEGKDIAKALLAVLDKHRLNSAEAKIYVQSFEPESLMRIRLELKSDVKLIQLIADNTWGESNTDYEKLLTDEGLEEIASYAQGIGPWLPQVIDFNDKTDTGLIKRAHTKGLLVHPFTFRTDVLKQTIAPKQAFERLKALKIDGLFTDQVTPYMLE